jgi:putative sterol carrier protein
VAEVTTDLFESLRRRGHEPLLQRAHGTMRFELLNGHTDRWTVAIDGGKVDVSHANRKADCEVRAAKHVFDAIASGETNAMAAVLRGAVTVDGDPELFVLFQRLFPEPPSRSPRTRRGETPR